MALMDSLQRVVWLLASSGGEGGGFSLMDVHFGTIFWTIVIFVLVAVLLGALVWKPIIRAVNEREKRIRESLEKADHVQAEAEKALEAQKRLAEDNRKEAGDFLAKAKEDAQKAADDLVVKARKEAEELTERARRQIDDEKQRALKEIRGHAVELALEAAGHLLGKTLDDETHRTIVKEYIDKIPGHLKQKH